MIRSLFSVATNKAPLSLIPKCGACGLYKQCRSPKMPWSGKGEKKVLIVAEVPSRTEDDRGLHLCGEWGQLLQDVLRSIDIDMRTDCWLTNAIICRPESNRKPTDAEIDYCRPNLTNTIRELKPRVIIPLGLPAVKSLIGPLWKEDVGAMGRWVGWRIPNQKPNTWICPNWHPSYIGSNPNDKALHILFKQYLKDAFALKGRPWAEPPDFESQVAVILNPDEAATRIRQFIKNSERWGDKLGVAFDYETNMLKPDSKQAWIACCSISDGTPTGTIAYPWMGEAIKASQEFIRSPVPKIASNLKFEERWTKAILGHGVRNWQWDTMLGAHWIDNRPKISGLKFQSYVLLGMPDYDSHVRPYLKADASNKPNRIKELPLQDLLLYCGLDSLLEVKVAKIQQDIAGYTMEKNT